MQLWVFIKYGLQNVLSGNLTEEYAMLKSVKREANKTISAVIANGSADFLNFSTPGVCIVHIKV